jgi:hypothetical protein
LQFAALPIASIALIVLSSCSRGTGGEDFGLSVRDLTGARTRVVWVQTAPDDPRATSSDVALMGLDSEDGRGERPILAERRNYTKPLITPAGDRIVFTDRPSLQIHVVNWDGTGLKPLAPGFGVAVWRDPVSGVDWMYAARDLKKEGTYARIVRFPIERPDDEELVWDRTLVGEEFQVSPDGRLAGGLFPWPDVGVAELPNGSLRKLGEGCWPALAALDPPVFWYFDGAHRNVTLVRVGSDDRWRVPINRAPGFGNAEVYFPRWTNDPRFLTLAGPYNLGTEDVNQARLGGPQVEVYLGKFSADFARVDVWARVTKNDRGDSYPDVWIDTGGAGPVAAPAGRPAQPSAAASASANDAAARRLVLEVRLTAPVAIPTPRSILPYRHALAVHQYEVVRVIEGEYGERTIPVAHWVIRDGQVLSEARRQAGAVSRVTVEPYDLHPELEGERLVMGGQEPTLPIYYDVAAHPR